MKRVSLLRVFATAILLSLLLAVTPGTPVLAAPVLNVWPASGAVGTKVTVTAENFHSYEGDNLHLFFGNQRVTITPITVTQTGRFSVDFSIPAGTAPKQYQIRVEGELGTLAVTSFTVLKAGISLDRNSGVVGTKITINGQGFYADREVNFYYDNRMLGTEAASGTGGFSYSFAIPDSIAGKHKVEAKNAEGHSAEAGFEVLPSITVNPTSAAANDILAVSGSGFSSRSNIDIYFGYNEVAYAKTNEFGSFDVAFFNVPLVASGAYDVMAKDKDGNMGEAAFAVIAGAVLDKTVANVGDEVTISGTGFTVGGTITITYDDVSITKIVADSDGSFTAAFQVKPSKHRDHVITVSDGINTKQLAFTIDLEPTFALPNWAIYTLIGVGALVIGFFIFRLGRRTAY